MVIVVVVVVVVMVVVARGSSDTVAEIWNNRHGQSVIWEPPDSHWLQASAL
jgi:hypothetical protein